MTIQELIKYLEELRDDYFKNCNDKQLSRSTREYFCAKYYTLQHVIKCIKSVIE